LQEEVVEVSPSNPRLNLNNKLLDSGISLPNIRHKLTDNLLTKLNSSGKDSSSRDLLVNLDPVALKKGMFHPLWREDP
jgi:hypothetical protein